MNGKVLMTASTLNHIVHFHLPYIRQFYECGWEVHVAGAGEECMIPCTEETLQLKFEKSFFSASNFKAAWVLRKNIINNKYDLVICHTSLAAFFTRIACAGVKRQTKIINVVHGYLFDDDTPFLKAAVLKAAEYITAPLTDMVVTMNEWDRIWAEKHGVGKKTAFTRGIGYDANKNIDPDKELDLAVTADDFVLIYPAEFSKRKNQAMLIRAMRLLPESVKLILPGKGAMLEECADLAKELGLEQRVIFPGHIKNVPAMLAKADAAVSSSRSEGLPFNILEAISEGLPVVASDVKGNNELVKDGVNGFLFPFGDEEAFVSAVFKLLDGNTNLAAMGNAGRHIAEDYSVEKVVPRLMAEYMSVLS